MRGEGKREERERERGRKREEGERGAKIKERMAVGREIKRRKRGTNERGKEGKSERVKKRTQKIKR